MLRLLSSTLTHINTLILALTLILHSHTFLHSINTNTHTHIHSYTRTHAALEPASSDRYLHRHLWYLPVHRGCEAVWHSKEGCAPTQERLECCWPALLASYYLRDRPLTEAAHRYGTAKKAVPPPKSTQECCWPILFQECHWPALAHAQWRARGASLFFIKECCRPDLRHRNCKGCVDRKIRLKKGYFVQAEALS